jgi:hypothetical protein
MTDDYENLQPPSQQAEVPQAVSGNTGAGQGGFPQSPDAATENLAPHVPLNVQAFEDSAAESFSIAASASGRLDDVQGMYTAGTEAYETIAHAVRASFEEVAAGFSEFNTKLMEFGRVNAQNNMAFMQSVAGVRSVRDAVDVQTAFMRGQYDAAATQLRELQALTTEIAEKAAAPFKQQFARSTQMFRSC